MQGRGEPLTAIAELAGVKVGEVRAVLKAAGARTASRPGALGATGDASGDARGADGAAVNGAAVNGAAAQPLGVRARLGRQPMVSVRSFSVGACFTRPAQPGVGVGCYLEERRSRWDVCCLDRSACHRDISARSLAPRSSV